MCVCHTVWCVRGEKDRVGGWEGGRGRSGGRVGVGSDTLHLVHSSPTQRVVSSKVISHPNFTDFTFKFSDSLHSVLTLEKEVEWARVEDGTGQV